MLRNVRITVGMECGEGSTEECRLKRKAEGCIMVKDLTAVLGSVGRFCVKAEL